MALLNEIKLSRKPLAGFLVIGCAWATCFAQMPMIKAGIGASDAVLGAAILIGSVGALAAMWLAPMANSLAGRWAMPFAACLVGIGMLSIGAAPGVIAFTLGMILASAGSGVVDVLVNVRISEIEEHTARKLMNLNHALYSFAYAGAAVTTGGLRELGWSPFEIFAVLGCVILALAIFSLEARQPKSILADLPASEGLSFIFVTLAGLVVMVAFLMEASAEGWSALHLERTLGGGAAQGSMGPAILGLTMGIGRLMGHVVAHRISEMTLMVAACLLAAFGLVLAGIAPGLSVAYLGFGLAGLGVSVIAPLTLALVGRVVPPDARLAAISRVSVLGYGAFFLGPPLMGFTSEFFGLRAGFILVAAIMVATALLLLPALGRSANAHPKRGNPVDRPQP